MPFSQTFPMCCINIRNLVDQFYQFVEGVDQHHADIDELLRKVGLYRLLQSACGDPYD
jgi:hypothetical protein